MPFYVFTGLTIHNNKVTKLYFTKPKSLLRGVQKSESVGFGDEAEIGKAFSFMFMPRNSGLCKLNKSIDEF